jgi:DNA mismatch repair protein MutL
MPLAPGVRSAFTDGEAAAQKLYGPPEESGGLFVKDDGGTAPWQLDRRYIVVPRDRALLIVDQHAAHERILYEQVLGRWSQTATASQKLLFPEVLEVGEERVEAFERVANELRRLGFEAELFGRTSLLVQGVPRLTHRDAAPALLAEILDELTTDEARRGEALEVLAKAFACRCAVKSGAPLHAAEMRQLLKDLFEAGVPHGDPHGRPTYVELRVEDLDRRFQRS